MEGKSRFGIASSGNLGPAGPLPASNGSVNSMHDSYTPIGGMITMLQMQLEKSFFGGVRWTVWNVRLAILAVFIAGLMVGPTPRISGKGKN